MEQLAPALTFLWAFCCSMAPLNQRVGFDEVRLQAWLYTFYLGPLSGVQ